MNINTLIAERINEIEESINNNISSITLDLSDGFLGISLFYYYLFLYKKDESYLIKSIEILESVFFISTSSSKVPHESQLGHFPSHFLLVYPHSEQIYPDFDAISYPFLILSALSSISFIIFSGKNLSSFPLFRATSFTRL